MSFDSKYIPHEHVEHCGFAAFDDSLEVAHHGFGDFNGGPHLCVKVPDGTSTISCLTKDVRRITFSFVPYKADGPPECVDIQNHHRGPAVDNHGKILPSQDVIAFGYRKSDIHIQPEQGYSLITCILQK